jgi:hypothetical protein
MRFALSFRQQQHIRIWAYLGLWAMACMVARPVA